MAALILNHEPGWRLPQLTALARRFNVAPVDVEGVIRDLAARHLVRETPDGRLYRASPADYLIALEGIPGIGASIDPMGASITCVYRKVSWRRTPEEIAQLLCLGPAAEASVIRCLWVANGCRAAVSTTYMASSPGEQTSVPDEEGDPLGAMLWHTARAVPGRAPRAGPVPTAVHVEMQAPPPHVTRSLELAPGEPAITVTARFSHPSGGQPVALTAVSLRAALFRVILDAPEGPGKPGQALADAGDLAGYVAEWDQ